jgi:hypothetical protein
MTVRDKTTGVATAEAIAAEAAVGDAAAEGIAEVVHRVVPGEGTCHRPNMPRHRAANPVVTIIAAGNAADMTIAVRKRRGVRGLPPWIPRRRRFSFQENLSPSTVLNL